MCSHAQFAVPNWQGLNRDRACLGKTGNFRALNAPPSKHEGVGGPCPARVASGAIYPRFRGLYSLKILAKNAVRQEGLALGRWRPTSRAMKRPGRWAVAMIRRSSDRFDDYHSRRQECSFIQVLRIGNCGAKNRAARSGNQMIVAVSRDRVRKKFAWRFLLDILARPGPSIIGDVRLGACCADLST